MARPIEDINVDGIEIVPESETDQVAKFDSWRQIYKRQNPDATDEDAQLYVDNKRKRKIKIAQDKVIFENLEKQLEEENRIDDLASELSEDNYFHPIHTSAEQNDGTNDGTNDDLNGRILVNMRPQLAVNIMRVDFPLEIIDEINDHVDNTIIPNNEDFSSKLVGQINRNERSAQLRFPHEEDETGRMVADVLEGLAKQYIKSTIDTDCVPEVNDMWTIHSYEGDYNPLHDHGSKTPIGLSCILYLKVPEQIAELEAVNTLNSASGAVDGFTYLQWGTNGMRDVNILRPKTDEYIKPEVGTLIMFPSWLRHSVNPFFGEGERRTFSANLNIGGLHYMKTGYEYKTGKSE